MALLLVYDLGKSGRITSFIFTQVIAFIVFSSWVVVDTDAYGQFECGASECIDDVQSSEREHGVNAKVGLDFDPKESAFHHQPQLDFPYTKRHNHAGMRNQVYLHGLKARPHYTCKSGSGSGRAIGSGDKRGTRRRRRARGLWRGKNQLLETNNTTDSSSLHREMEALILFKAGVFYPRRVFADTLSTWRETDSTPCSWSGVSCSLNSSNNAVGQNHVIAVNLTGSHLTGSIDSALHALRSLQFLEQLDLSNNLFTGSMPGSIFANWSSLLSLSMSNNLISGEIPRGVGELINLQTLDLNRNELTGAIPKELGRLSKLRELRCSSNNISGSIPAELGNCTSLLLVQLGKNKLTGNLPAEIGRLSNLQIFSIGYGSISGLLPASLSNLTQIIHFDAGYNSFTGPIGYYWGGFSKLASLRLAGNNFSSSVPGMVGNWSQLHTIDFSFNNLSGVIPPSLRSFPALEVLLLSNNRLRGVIPPDLVSTSNLVALDLSGNNLEGNIPSNIGTMSALQYLNLSSNKLTGGVPESLSKCGRMITLDLSQNQFGGGLPANTLFQMGNLRFLNLSSNAFFGAWPPMMTSLKKIEEINVSGNSISGQLSISALMPADSGWRSLVKLDISRNDFAGGIPNTLGFYPALRFFNASYNDFEGPIPASGIFKSYVGEASFLGNPLLCGDVLGPGRECRAARAPSGKPKSCKGFRCRRVWIPTLCGIVLLMVGVVLVFLVVFLWTKIRRGKNRETTRVHAQDLIMSLSSHEDEKFSSKDVLKIIHEGGDNVIGKGSKSVVYKGTLDNKVFAVKVFSHSVYGNKDVTRLGASHSRERKEVLKGVHIMAKLRHRNILRVVGYCSKQETQVLILEYMPQGSLRKHLHAFEDPNCSLSWQTRLNIALGIAEGLKYLHHDFPEPVIHGDLKPSNVLLDSTFLPKVADFGLSSFVSPHRKDQASISRILGTIGYMPPEYAIGSVLSTRGDVYSFGIVLLELLTGRSPGSNSDIYFDPSIDYRNWVLQNYCQHPISLLDSTLQGECMTENRTSEQVRLMLLVALFCTREIPQSRPTMNDTLTMLIQIREIRLTPTENKSIEELANTPSYDACTRFWSNEDPNGTSSPVVSTYAGPSE